ncbi:hypothetical protein BDR06DRAFT_1009234 [Suillus hirtellus]|nr:hypothetical protein BDR06DRAFT_1009234 [Suillus hirtellus]
MSGHNLKSGPATLSDLSTPTTCYSMDVNALNYCRFSLLVLAGASTQEGLLAIPNLVESALADIRSLPSCQRPHAAIGDPLDTSATAFLDGRSGSITSVALSL